MTSSISVAILGASGYTGAELLRLLAQHPHAQVKALTGDSQAGKKIGEVFPHLATAYDLPLVKHEEVDYTAIDLVFCCLPHGTTQAIIAALPKSARVVDLSADFRLFDLDDYAKWYGHAHQAPSLQQEAVYGLTELVRSAVSKARLVANPGCYPTSILLPLLPLLKAKLIQTQHIAVASMSGVSGAGRKAAQGSLYTEVAEGLRAYGVGGHRHVAEIEQELANAAGESVTISFTPHLVPMNRGINSTMHVTGDADALRAHLVKTYQDEPFVYVCPKGIIPSTQEVRGTNQCRISVVADRRPGQAIIVSVIDNLVKGASGQAVQNMNAMFGLPETIGLPVVAMFP
jgi:N-acetyl-gamma-glutamyl-phosphate reductase